MVTFYVANGRSTHALFLQIWGFAGVDADARELVRELYRSIGQFIFFLVKASNPALSDEAAQRAVIQIFSLEEGMKLFFGLAGADDDPAPTAENDIRDLTRSILATG